MTEEMQFPGSYVSQGSAETPARRGGTANHHLIAYSLSSISAKNHQNRLMCIEVIMSYISVDILRHSLLVRTILCVLLHL